MLVSNTPYSINFYINFLNHTTLIIISTMCIMTALDAYCLLEIYTTLAQGCEHSDIPFQDICAEIQHIPHRHLKKTPKKYLDRVGI